MKTFFLILITPLILPAHTITHYTAHTPTCHHHQATLRTFDLDGKGMELVVDTRTLQTSIQPKKKGSGHRCGHSHYTELLEHATTAPWPLTNDGITHQKAHGVTITTDLCPSSKKGFEKKLYEALIAHAPHPVPVTLFITGGWIRHHRKALGQFRQWEREGKLAITWGNHTYRHPYHKGKPYKHNFALTPGYDLRSDTLRLEQYLIARGITPSIFFRFPGLVSNKQTIQTIHDLGLIPIGTDAWIAKGQTPKKGSIVLLHGNKNEPKGVRMFLEMLRKNQIQSIVPLHP